MKILKFSKILLTTFILCFTIVVAGAVQEVSGRQQFFSIKDHKVYSVEIEENKACTATEFNELFALAKKEKIVFVKYEYLNRGNIWVNDLYFSLDSPKEIAQTLGIDYVVTQNKNADYASTEKANKTNLWIRDFLQDDHFNLYPMKSAVEKEMYLFGGYRVYFKTPEQLNAFLQEAETFFPAQITIVNEYQTMDFGQNYYLILGSIVLVLSLLTYFILEIFNMYSQSKKMSVMQLLGLGSFRICFFLIKRELLLCLGISAVLLLGGIAFLPKIGLAFLIKMFFLNLLGIFLIVLLAYLSVWSISRSYSIVDLLKNRKIVQKLVHAGVGSKMLLNTCFLFLLLITFTGAGDFFSLREEIQNIQSFANQAFFRAFHMENDQYDDNDHSRLNHLYQKLSEAGVDFQYIEYANYDLSVGEAESIRRTNLGIRDKEYFPIITVDVNYLHKVGVKIKDASGKEVTLKDAPYERFLLPEGWEKYCEGFETYYQDELNKAVGHEQVKSDFSRYIYEPQDLPAYSINAEGKTIVPQNLLLKYPIIRVTYPDYPINYIDEPYGLCVAGMRQVTGLKIAVDASKEETYQKILPILKEEGIDKILPFSFFMTMGEYIGAQFSDAQLLFAIEGSMLLLVFVVYTIISFEVNCLLLEKEKERYAVRTFMGHDYKDIYMKTYLYSLAILTVPVLLILLIHFLVMPIIQPIFLVILLAMVAYESLMLGITTGQVSIDNAVSLIRGE